MKNFPVLLTIGLFLAASLLMASCSEEDTTQVDTLAPSVRITSPRDSVRIAGSIQVRASASDNVMVEAVEFYANGISLGRDTQSPYQVIWSPSVNREDRVGTDFVIKARAWDTAGNTTLSAGRMVTFFIDSLPPSISILAPAEGAEITGPVTIRTAPVDNDLISRVDFVIDNQVIGSVHEEPWDWNWNVGPWANGLSHTITVKAVDFANLAGVSNPVSVTVSILAAPPRVTITSPGSVNLLGDLATITATATDQDEVVQVDFFLDAIQLASLTTPPWTIPLELVYYANGEPRLIEAEATDARGNVGSATPVRPTVSATAALVLISPANQSQLPQSDPAQIAWETIASAVEYGYEIARDPDFTEIAMSGTTPDTQFNMGVVEDGWYYWHANVANELVTSPWSATRSFHVGTIFSKKAGGPTNNDRFRYVEAVDDGGFVAVGYRGANASGDSSRQAYLLKSNNATGPYAWVKQLGAANGGSELSQVIELDGGNLVAIGYRKIDSGPDGIHRDLWLIETDSVGETIWETFHGGEGNQEGFSVTRTPAGGYMAVGYTTSGGAGGHDLYLLQTDASGNETGSWTFGGAGYDIGNSIQATADGGYVMVGNTTSMGRGGKDIWLLKVDGSGTMQWQKTKGLALDEWGRSVRQLADGGYLVSGTTQSFGSGPSDGIVWRTDGAGEEIWGRTYGTRGTDGLSYLAETLAGDGYILTGTSKQIWAGQGDLWLLRLDLNGDVLWSKTYGLVNGADQGTCVQSALDGGFIIVGSTGTTSQDAWMLKTSSNGQTVPVN